MNFKSLNFKIYLGSAYLIVLLMGIYFLFSNFNISDLASYEFIRENKDLILKYKENNIFFLTIIFFVITVILNVLLTPMFLPTLIVGSELLNPTFFTLSSIVTFIEDFSSTFILFSLFLKDGNELENKTDAGEVDGLSGELNLFKSYSKLLISSSPIDTFSFAVFF